MSSSRQLNMSFFCLTIAQILSRSLFGLPFNAVILVAIAPVAALVALAPLPWLHRIPKLVIVRPVVIRGLDVSLLVDLQTMRTGLHATSVCETSTGVALPPATVRRLACDANILPIIMNGPSQPLDLGRSQRLASRPQRRALRAAHRTCVVPGCTVPFESCRIHHVRWWTRDHGPSDIDNLLTLCENHHHLVHEGGWILTLDHQRRATLLPPIARANPPPTRATG